MMERCGFRCNHQLDRKFGAAVVAARRGGAIHVFDTINHFFLINNMICVGSSYWNDGYSPNGGINEVKEDEEAKRTMTSLAKTWLG